MKRMGSLLAFSLAVTVAAPAAKASPKDDAGRGAALIARAVEAFGGAAVVDAVTGLEVKGKGTRRVQAADLPLTMVTRYHLPDHYYQEVRLAMVVIKTVVSPKGAFIVAGEAPFPLPEEERQALVKLVQRQVVFLLRARGEAGFRAAAAGPVTVDGKTAERVEVTYKGDTVLLAIEQATGRVLQSEYASPAGPTAPGSMVISYSDYRKVGRLAYPHVMVGVVGTEPAFTLNVESVEVNPPLDEAAFVPPLPHATAPGAAGRPLSPPPTLLPVPSPSPSVSPRE